MARDGCIFCRIVSGEEPAHKVHEDERTLTIMDAFPAGEGHVLILTREHHENIHEIPQETLCAVAAMSKRVACALRSVLDPDGIGVYQLNGPAAGQSVFHYHMHLIPRHEGQKRSVHGGDPADGDRLADLARRIAEALED
ncbi:MAG: HIT family protein [Candidatus Eisenbacteria bacterium]|nr:HIT family protein [Candidatus Eisenbacteria bacterium]